MPDDLFEEAKWRVQQWEMKVEALEKKYDRAAMGKVIEAGALSKLDAELSESKKHLADAEAVLRGCEKDSGTGALSPRLF